MKMYEEEIQVCGPELEISAGLCSEQNVAYNNKPSFQTLEGFFLQDPGSHVLCEKGGQ